MFQFKQFSIKDDRCAMKVGTDGVLLGAWADIDNASSILDIGTGCGLIAIMAAQRNRNAQITAIDIDEDAVAQAKENVQNSPWHERINVGIADIRSFSTSTFYDAILCNPPFYQEQTYSPSLSRTLARNARSLPFCELTDAASKLLTEEGLFHVILPTNAYSAFMTQCLAQGLSPVRKCMIKTVERKEPKRLMLTLSKRATKYNTETLVLQGADGMRSQEYTSLTQDFYL